MSANRRYPFGYAMKDGKIRIVPEEAEVVEMLFTPGIWLGKPPPDWRNRRRTGAFLIIRETHTGTKTWFAGFSIMQCISEKKTARR